MEKDLKEFYNNIIIEYFSKLGCGIMPDRLRLIRDKIEKLGVDYTEQDIEGLLNENIPYINFKVQEKI